jgi:hypothetical protein
MPAQGVGVALVVLLDGEEAGVVGVAVGDVDVGVARLAAPASRKIRNRRPSRSPYHWMPPARYAPGSPAAPARNRSRDH